MLVRVKRLMMDVPRYKIFRIVTTIVLTLPACSTLPPAAQNYDSFAEYAEAVFRHQNELTSRIMMLSDTDYFSENDRLQRAEQAMNDACHLLNEYAEHEIDGEAMGIFFQRKVQSSIENCDVKIKHLENMLAELTKSRDDSD
ncbi:hypothetical protein [Methylomonas sp. MgM2]